MANHNKPPAFQFYPKDWLSSETVICMTAEQRGWYIQLLCHSWNGEPIASLPAEDGKLKVLAGAADNWTNDKQAVLDCFELENGRLVNRKLADQYQELVAYHSKQRENGRRGAASRWNKEDGDGNGGAMATPMAKDGSSTVTVSATATADTVTVTGGTQTDTQQAEQEEPNPTLNVSGDWMDSLVLDETEQRKFQAVMVWKESLSDFWKGKPLVSLKGYRTVESHYDKFYARLPGGKKPHELALAASATPATPWDDEPVELPKSKAFQVED